jgi:hypothetical protein
MYKSRIEAYQGSISNCLAVLRIRTRRIRMFLGLQDPDPDPIVRTQRYGSGSGSGSFYHQAKIVRNAFIPNVL